MALNNPKKGPCEIHWQQEYGAAFARTRRHKVTAGKLAQKKKRSITKGALVAATASAVVVAAAITSFSLEPKAVTYNSAEFGVSFSQASVKDSETVEYTLVLLPDNETVASASMRESGRLLFSNLRSSRTYTLSFTTTDKDGTRLLATTTFTTPAPPAAPPEHTGGAIIDEVPPPAEMKTVVVPSLLGKSEADAKAALSELELPYSIVYADSEEYDFGLVAAQSHTGTVAEKTKIAITVSTTRLVLIDPEPLGIGRFEYYFADRILAYSAAWRANDATDVSYSLTVGGATYDAREDTGKYLKDGVYTFANLSLPLSVGEGFTGFEVGTSYTVRFTISYTLGGERKTSTQSKTVKYGGAVVESLTARFSPDDRTLLVSGRIKAGTDSYGRATIDELYLWLFNETLNYFESGTLIPDELEGVAVDARGNLTLTDVPWTLPGTALVPADGSYYELTLRVYYSYGSEKHGYIDYNQTQRETKVRPNGQP